LKQISKTLLQTFKPFNNFQKYIKKRFKGLKHIFKIPSKTFQRPSTCQKHLEKPFNKSQEKPFIAFQNFQTNSPKYFQKPFETFQQISKQDGNHEPECSHV